jgi:Domain of unknown function (DUF4157)
MFAPKVAKPQTKAAASSTNKLVPQHSALATRPFGGGTVEQAHFLQRTIGNQATLRLLAQRTSKPAGDQLDDAPAQEHDGSAALGLSWDFSKIPVFPPDRPNRPRAPSLVAAPPLPGDIQPKLAVGDVNDPLEREADRVADQVMRMPDPRPSTSRTTPHVSRKCADCEAEDMLQATPPAPAKSAAGEAPISLVHEVLRRPGQPLDDATRTFFGSRFGYDFSRVRVHADGTAAAAARALNAAAFTLGADIVFDAGRYVPATNSGRGLLAHELAHVMQQSGRAMPATLQRQSVPLPDYK